MKHIQAFANRPSCIIGGDIPNITKLKISKAFRKLDQEKLLLAQPRMEALLIGHQGASRKLFEGVRWSSS